MSFEKHSNFNKLANFSEVKFGENKPVLEVELNEMQQIQNEARADIIRDTMPSGFVTLGEIDYEHCANNNNQIKLKTESIAYVNGYRITIPKDTIIEIGESDKEREDLVFLEVWKEAVNDIDTLTEYGGEDNSVINNPIKDERYPVATSRRVQLKYRIRVIDDFNFNESYHSTTIGCAENYIGWHDGGNFSKVYAMGANPTLKLPKGIKGIEIFRSPISGWGGLTINDAGLWVAGLPNDEASKKRYKTLDGLVYAIPMFRLIRKPHVGLASPFEYKKIHNQLDPKKFAHLVGQENVEKVHSVNIKGKTFKNLITHAKQQGHGVFNVNVSPDIVTFDTNASWGKLGFLVNGEPDTKYVFHCSDFYKGEKSVEFYVRLSDSIHATAQRLDKIDSNTYTFTADSSGVFMFSFEISGGVSGAYVKYPILMKYSEWEEQIRGKKIVGVQSLGELDNNSITVENNLVEEGTYVHELQNHILPTHPEVTHVTWGEDVVIPPEVEIELKNGEEVIQTITQLPVKLETTGEEKLHVKTMKGQTLVNVNRSKFVVNSAITGDYGNAISKFDTDMKASTTYTVIAYSDNQYEYRLSEMRNTTEVALNNDRPLTVGVPTVFTTNENFTSLRGYLKGNTLNIPQGTEIKILIIEGDHSNENIPYFEGMQSVKTPVLTTTGKNLFDVESVFKVNGNTVKEVKNGSVVLYKPPHNSLILETIKVKANTTYTISCEIETIIDGGRAVYGIGGVTENKTAMSDSSGNLALFIRAGDQNSEGEYKFYNIQLEEGTQATPYEPFKSNILTVNEDVTLRGIGNVKDELDLLTGEVVERIGEIVLDGSEDEKWSELGLSESGKSKGFIVPISNKKSVVVKCDKLPLTHYDDIIGIKQGGTASLLQIRMTTEYLSSLDIVGFRTWLAQNPITVQYQLATESIKTVDLSDNHVYSYKGTTHYDCSSAEGSLVPTLSIDVPTNLPAVVTRQRVTIQELEKENVALKNEIEETANSSASGDLELMSSQFELDFRLFEIEMNLDMPMMAMMRGVKSMAMTVHQQAKTLILAGKYEREDMEYKLNRYKAAGRITVEEYDELIALMDARELVD